MNEKIAAKLPNLNPKRIRVSALEEGWRKLTRPKTVEIAGNRLHVDPTVMDQRTRSQAYRGVYEVTKLVAADAITKPEDRVLELGGGLGLVTVMAARKCEQGRVTTYEAVPQNASLIERNLELNSVSADVRARAIGAEPGEIEFYVTGYAVSSSSSAVRADAATDKIMAPRDAIASVMEEIDPTVLFIDIEGMEDEVVPLLDL
ncbi:MAG: FkbM family methyltransferase, partial [Pseudomonadota bacterium]